MAYKSDILLGRITKTSGYEGAVRVRLEKRFIDNIPEMESVFLEVEGRLVPFFISFSEYNGADILKLMFEGYESAEKVSEFTGCNVYLTLNNSETELSDDISYLIGYKVIVRNEIVVGIIKELMSNSGQWLLKIDSPQKKEILIPLHEDFIVSIDQNKKIIEMDIPEGLSEIN
jgi:16S rRNA processing protein RimM